MRLYYIGPTFVSGQQVSYFDQSLWTAGKAPQLFQPVCPNNAATCSATVRQARNPLTGELLNNTYIGKLVPGSGDFNDGMHIVNGTPYNGWGVMPAPRGGFAWDVAGDGKTAVTGAEVAEMDMATTIKTPGQPLNSGAACPACERQ